MLPKFLLADNSQELPDTIFVVHTQAPKCIIESDVDDFYTNQSIHWIDDAPENKASNPLLTLASILISFRLPLFTYVL